MVVGVLKCQSTYSKVSGGHVIILKRLRVENHSYHNQEKYMFETQIIQRRGNISMMREAEKKMENLREFKIK